MSTIRFTTLPSRSKNRAVLGLRMVPFAVGAGLLGLGALALPRSAQAQTTVTNGSSGSPATAPFNLQTTASGGIYAVAGSGMPVMFEATNSVFGSAVVDGGGSTAYTLINQGSIASTGGEGAGVYLSSSAGGTVNNTATIAGVAYGVYMNSTGVAETVNNGWDGSSTTYSLAARITGSGGPGIRLMGAGSIVNNYATILSTAQGVLLSSGGTVTNGAATDSSAQITSSGNSGVELDAPGGTVNNYATIFSTAPVGTSCGNTNTYSGVIVPSGIGTINNYAGTITGPYYGVYLLTGTVTNAGTIQSTTTLANCGDGIYFPLVSGTPTVGTVTNTGTITGSGTDGIFFANPGTVSIANSGAITGPLDGIQLGSSTTSSAGGNSTVTNSGSITGINGNGVVVLAGSGTIDNAAEATISGATNGVQFGTGPLASGATVQNDGTITSTTNSGILMQNGGTVVNDATGVIKNTATAATGQQDGITITGSTGSVTNSGTISSSIANGVNLQAGGTVSNTGSITGQTSGVALTGGGTVTNSSGGTITGTTSNGVYASGGVTVNSSATITGKTNAVQFVTGNNTLNLESGSTTNGIVFMGSGSDTTTVFNGANIGGVPKFNNGTGNSILIFNGYAGPSNAILAPAGAAWQEVQATNSADVSFDGSETYAATLFQIDGGSALGFSTQNGTLTGNVNNAGTLNYGAGTGGAAYVIQGTLTNSGTVALAGASEEDSDTLTVSSYVGGGTIDLNTDLGASDSPSDVLVIDGGTATGTTTLNITNTTGLGALTTGNGILVVNAIDGATTASGAFTLASGPITVNGYTYSLFRGGVGGSSPQNWYLRTTAGPGFNNGTGTGIPTLNPAALALLALVLAGLALWQGRRRHLL